MGELAHGLTVQELYHDDALARVDALFVASLEAADDDLAARLAAGRANPEGLDSAAESALLGALAPHLDGFIGELFSIRDALAELACRQAELAPLYACKRVFVQRRAAKAMSPIEAAAVDGPALGRALEAHLGGVLDQVRFATRVMGWLEDEAAHGDALELATGYAAWALLTEAGRRRHADDILFRAPEHLDHADLVPAERERMDGIEILRLPAERRRRRDGFRLTDPGTDLVGALDEAHYCIICHQRGKDACSHGDRDRKTGAFAVNPLGVGLLGCPLEEKISEMNQAKRDGHAIAALAIIAIDNPMAAATGHRICNDCIKACIYQKQDPVDIPQAETRMLRDVLALPWGFEIYSLLTRWNPLNIRRPLPRPASGYKVLVVGLGPAGFTLAHHLMNDGHAVVAIDGAKIEPLEPELSGVGGDGARVPFRPIRDIADITEPLDERVMAGFGGVAEYGITVRWDKNFLKVVRLLLERRHRFAMFGGVRFGGQIDAERAWDLGFDHIALCLGAGKPTFLPVPNGLAGGVRQASDFLMALQLTGAAKRDSIANLQIRMPVVVIGGGLTAIDTATEALAYYVTQVEKFVTRFDALVAVDGEAAVRGLWTDDERDIAEEALAHGRAVQRERARAEEEGSEPDFSAMLDLWGGATVAYRRRLRDSPSYTLNHEEISKALEEGVRFAELLAPSAIEVDSTGQARFIRLARQRIGADNRPQPTGEEVLVPAHSILVAAGTDPNTVLAREHPGLLAMDGKFFQAVDDDGTPVSPERSAKPETDHVIAKIGTDGRAISFFGDLHPSFAGNVVKAMASARRGHAEIGRILGHRPTTPIAAEDLVAGLNDGLRARVVEVKRRTPTIVEVIVHAPFAANAFRPGQFFRLQNYEATARRVLDTTLAMEGLALTGAWVDRERGLVSMIVLEMGGSSDLCRLLEPGEPVVLMGPTGAPTEIAAGETVLLAGGGLGNAVLFSIGQAFRDAGSKVLYFAAYRLREDCYHVAEIEKASDTVVWCCQEEPGLAPSRAGDMAFVGNVIEAMVEYAEGRLGPPPIPIADVDRIIAIGSHSMMGAVTEARHGVLRPYLKAGHTALGSINSPMQCMMKEICAQCLQPHHDPETGADTVVFSCFSQDQPLDHVDFRALNQRLGQNSVQEKLTRRWVALCLETLEREAAADA